MNLGLTDEVRHAIKQTYYASGIAAGQSIQDVARELILRGAAVECDEAALAITKTHLKAAVEKFAVRRLQEFLRDLAKEVEVYLRSNPLNEGEDQT